MGYDKNNKENWQRKECKSYMAKRGKLAPMMTEEAKNKASIHELSYDFGCRITRLYLFFTDPVHGFRFTDNGDKEAFHEREYIMSKQVYRSGTSITRVSS